MRSASVPTSKRSQLRRVNSTRSRARSYRASHEEKLQMDKQAEEEQLRQVVHDHTYQTSGIVARSEGHAFDIVTNKIYNAEKVLRLDKNAVKGIPQRASLRQAWDYQRDVEEALRDADIGRSLNRMSMDRIVRVQSRGHDIVSNAPYGLSKGEDVAGKELDKTLFASGTARPLIPMGALQQQSVMSKLQPADGATGRNDKQRAAGGRPAHKRTREFSTFLPVSSALLAATFSGRRDLLLPTLQRASCPPSASMFGN